MSCNTTFGTSTWTDYPSYCEGLGLLRMTSFGATLQRNSCQVCCKLRCPKRFHKYAMPLRAQSWVHLTAIGLAPSTTNITENSTVHTCHNRLILSYLGTTELVLSWTFGMLHGTQLLKVYKIKVWGSRKGSKSRGTTLYHTWKFTSMKLSFWTNNDLCAPRSFTNLGICLHFNLPWTPYQSRHILCLLRYTGCSQKHRQQAFKLLLKCSTLNLGGTSELPSLLWHCLKARLM
jgi:hypothetical protein